MVSRLAWLRGKMNERMEKHAIDKACQFHVVTGEVKKKDHEKGNSEGNKKMESNP